MKRELWFGALAIAVAFCLVAGCGTITSARKSLVDQGSSGAQAVSDILAKYQAKTLDKAQQLAEQTLERCKTDTATWKAETESKGTFDTATNQWFYRGLLTDQARIQSDIDLIKGLREEANAVPVAQKPVAPSPIIAPEL